MTSHVTRRQFLAGAIAGAAQAAGSKASPPEYEHGHRPAVEDPEAPRLFLPATSGHPAGIKFANSPPWARNAPGWFLPSTISAGCCFLNVPSPLLPQAIRSFRELPNLLEQARSIGTEVVYLVDWYAGGWSNKGDYVPRADLGGEAAFRDGISALHAGGGRLILYVEGFIIAKESNVGQEHGRQWSILQPDGPLENPYPGCWKPCPGAEGWLTYIEGVARRIGQYGADGIFLDSCGFQRDWKCVSKAHRHPLASPEVFNQGCVELVRRVRFALRAGNPEAVVLTEGPKLQRLFEYADGSLDWGIHTFVRRWLWDAQGKTDTLTSGWSIDDWHQVLAIGGKLGCGPDILQPLLQPSASQLLEACRKSIQAGEAKQAVFGPAHRAFFGLHRWRNAGLILGLKMPGLDDLEPRPYEPGLKTPRGGADPLLKAAGAPIRTLDALRPRARAIDEALAGTRPPPAATYVKSLLTARRSLAPVIDYDSSVEMVRTPCPQAVGWRFTNNRGVVLTAVNVGDQTCRAEFKDAPGTWKDGVRGDAFTAQGNALTVVVPAHSVRLMRAETG
jgi:hypothetical protein